jgi:hypothetical protein
VSGYDTQPTPSTGPTTETSVPPGPGGSPGQPHSPGGLPVTGSDGLLLLTAVGALAIVAGARIRWNQWQDQKQARRDRDWARSHRVRSTP